MSAQLTHNVSTTLVKGCGDVRSDLTFLRRSYNVGMTFVRLINVVATLKLTYQSQRSDNMRATFLPMLSQRCKYNVRLERLHNVRTTLLFHIFSTLPQDIFTTSPQRCFFTFIQRYLTTFGQRCILHKSNVFSTFVSRLVVLTLADWLSVCAPNLPQHVRECRVPASQSHSLCSSYCDITFDASSSNSSLKRNLNQWIRNRAISLYLA